jgi:hypothetical protein
MYGTSLKPCAITQPSPKNKNIIYSIGLISFIFTLHTAIPAYVDSSYLSLFTDEHFIGEIYMAVAAVTVLCFFLIYRILKRYGDYATAVGLIILDAITLAGIVWGQSFAVIAAAFVLNMAILALISFTYDVFLETYTETAHTGGVRGWFLTITNSAWILAPLIAGMLIYGHVYTGVFIAALVLLAPVIYLVHKNFRRFPDSAYESPSAWATIREVATMPDIWKLCVINTVLNTFYCWMIIYTPLYLAQTIGFDWSSIGIILTIMLVPFVLIQLPFGKLADEKYGEKGLMGIGFLFHGTYHYRFGFCHFAQPDCLGGSAIHHSYRRGFGRSDDRDLFFQESESKESNILAAFRTTRQIPYFLAPAITGIGLFFTGSTGLFVILGVICLLPLILDSDDKGYNIPDDKTLGEITMPGEKLS